MTKSLLLAAALASILLGLGAALAADGPHAPCAGAPFPVFPAPDAPPQVQVWFSGDIEGGWSPDPCTGWEAGDFSVLVALAGRVRREGGLDGMLERIAAISTLESVRYWSTTRDHWRGLVPEAFALEGPDRDLRRADFSVEELRSGGTFYYWQQERSPAKQMLYRIRVRDLTPDQFVLEMENALPVRRFVITLFGPGQLQILHFLRHEGEGVWSYYSLARSNARIDFLVRGREASFVNRTVAIYRHFAGIPTDQEPPAAP